MFCYLVHKDQTLAIRNAWYGYAQKMRALDEAFKS